jgi:hypothetical protein
MISEPGWSPHGFSDYRRFFPATPDITPLVRNDATPRFIASWEQAGTVRRAVPPDTSFVFVRGLFGRWIPRHFARPLRALREAGFSAAIARSAAGGTVDANADAIGRWIQARLPRERGLVFLCHSKGGLDTLAMLERFPELLRRTRALVLCQTPTAGCAFLESVLLRSHRNSLRSRGERAKEAVLRAAIALCGAWRGCAELTGVRLRSHLARIERLESTVPVVSVASWSLRPTAWLDSQHARLGAIRPACAHDGLFFVEDLVWPSSEQVLVPRVDHSQPGVGGAGFDHGRFWLALARLASGRLS